MCIAILHLAGKTLSKENLIESSKFNNHGFGYMFVNNNELIIRNFLDYNIFESSYLEDAKSNQDTPFAVHFRYSTSGYKDLANCHPFKVSNTIGMIHNGIIQIEKEEGESDTNAFTKKILSPISSVIYKNETTRMFILDYIGSTNKLVFLNNEKQHLIFNDKEGEWEDGVWRSFKVQKYSQQITRNLVIYDNKEKCDMCGVFHSKKQLFTITTPAKWTKYVCESCMDNNLKVSDVFKYLSHFSSPHMRRN